MDYQDISGKIQKCQDSDSIQTQGLRNHWFHLQNEIKTRWGDSKNEIGFDVHHVYEQNEIKTRPIIVEKSPNLRNEIRTRRGDLLHLPYWAHIYTVSLFCCSEPGGSKPFKTVARASPLC